MAGHPALFYFKESLIKCPCRHAGENQHPVINPHPTFPLKGGSGYWSLRTSSVTVPGVTLGLRSRLDSTGYFPVIVPCLFLDMLFSQQCIRERDELELYLRFRACAGDKVSRFNISQQTEWYPSPSPGERG